MSQYVCTDCGYVESVCRCPEGHIRGWVKQAFVATVYYRQEAEKAMSALSGHVLTKAEEKLKRMLEEP